jgi:hypothetical protein
MQRFRVCWLAAISALLGCGGSGGGSRVVDPPQLAAARLAAADLTLGPAPAEGELVVRLASAPDAPSLLQVAIELPPELTLAPTDRLRAIAPVRDLDGDFVDGRFVVLCGDGQDQNAPALAPGDLFRVRLVPTLPRTPGTYAVRLVAARAATASGQPVPIGDPAVANVTVL